MSAVITTANAVARSGADTLDNVDRQDNHHLVEAALAAGVTRFVFTSALGACRDSPIPLLQAKAETGTLLRASGVAWTTLQPNLFMDAVISHQPPVAERADPVEVGHDLDAPADHRRVHGVVVSVEADLG